VVICLELGANLHMVQLMPLQLTVSCFSKIHIGFTFMVSAHPGSPGQSAVERVCVRACMYVCALTSATVMVATDRIAAAAQIDPSYSPCNVNVRPHDPWAHASSLLRKRYCNRFSRFCKARGCTEPHKSYAVHCFSTAERFLRSVLSRGRSGPPSI